VEEEIDLSGRPALLVRPARARWLYLLAHGAGAGMRHVFMAQVAEALAAAGVATLRWELPYMAAGRPRPDGPVVAQAAVREAWRAARARFGELPMFAGGKSFGGRMTSGAHAAEPLEGLCGLAFLGFPLHPPERPGIERAAHLAATAPAPLLFVQGTRDELATPELLRPVVAGLGRRARLHFVEHADHGFDVLVRSGRAPAGVLAEVAGEVAAWMERVTATAAPQATAAPKPRAPARRGSGSVASVERKRRGKKTGHG
jgi:hypothetical protein